jgi:hypothetical protein
MTMNQRHLLIAATGLTVGFVLSRIALSLAAS